MRLPRGLPCAAQLTVYPPAVTEIEKLLCDLIALPSVNPAFLPVGHPDAGEGRVAAFLAAAASRGGLDVELQTVLPGRANVLARLAPAGKVKGRILLAPHTDTVAAFSPGQFIPRRERGRVYGRGACDTKGSVASMLAALLALARKGPRPAETEIVFAGLIDEEHAPGRLARAGGRWNEGRLGRRRRTDPAARRHRAQGQPLVSPGNAGQGRPRVLSAIGPQRRSPDGAHGGHFANRVCPAVARPAPPLLGCATVSVGTIAGGSAANIVPARCEAVLDRRTLPGETTASVRAGMARLLRRHGLRAAIHDLKAAPCPPMETDPRLPLARKFLQVARQRKPAGADFFCDAAVLARGGHAQRGLRPRRHRAGAHGRRMDRAEIAGNGRRLPAQVSPIPAVS